MTPSRQDAAARRLAAIGSVLLCAGTIAGWAASTLFDAGAFAAHARRALDRSPALRRLVAETLVVSLVEARRANLIAVRPILVAGAETVVGTSTFADVFEVAVRQAHGFATQPASDSVVVRTNAAALLLIDSLRIVAPEAASAIPAGIEPALLRLHDVPRGLALWRYGARLRALGVILPAAGVLAWAGALALAHDRRRTLVLLGILLAGLGAVLLAGIGIASLLAGRLFDEPLRAHAARDALRTWVEGLRALAWVSLLAGLVVAAAGRAAGGERARASLRRLRAAGRALADGPRTGREHAALAIGGLAAGIAMATAPLESLAAVVTGLGLLLAYGGLVLLFDLVAHPSARAAGTGHAQARTIGLAGMLAALLALGTAAWLVFTRPRAVVGPRACNGRLEYCARRLDQIALPATHNAMATAADGFLLPNQERGIARQLRDGVRAFQIDAYLGSIRRDRAVRRVYTDLTPEKVGTIADAVGPELAARALEFRRVMGPPPRHARQDVYLCHNFCELGATKASSVMRTYRRFLERHPDDVLMLVVQDELPAERLLPVFREAGVEPYLAIIDPAAPMPALETLIASGRRLIVGLEHGDLGPRILNVFRGGLVQEVPYDFRTVEALMAPDACRPLRGRPDAPLFQFNHWLTPASVHAARRVNVADVLGERARRCGAERRLLPTLVAVDFYETGDLFAVVDRLNAGG